MTTFTIVSFIFVSLLSLIIFGLSLFLLIKLAQEKGFGHAILGFFFFPYPYIWGWINVKRLQIMDVMVTLTLMIVVGFIAPFMLAFFTATTGLQSLAEQSMQTEPISFNSTGEEGTFISSNDGEGNINVSFSSQAPTAMGTINFGQPVNGRLEDGFESHDWTFQGSAGQQVNIRVEGSGEIEPDVILLDPQGAWIADSEEETGAKIVTINSFSLPENGIYTIRIETWGLDGGDYSATLN